MQSLSAQTEVTHRQRIERYLAEGRTVSGGKGSDTAKKQMERDNARQDKAFNAQMDTLNSLKSNLMKYLTGNVGFDPQQLALMRSQFLGQNASDFNQARAGVTSMLASRGAGGGQVPVGGDYARGLSGLFGAEANSLASGNANINLANLSQALTNKFNTANILSGNAATLSSPISSFGAGASNALNAYIEAKNRGFGSSFMSGLGGALGGGFGKGIVGGIGGMMGGGSFGSGFQTGTWG